MIATNTVPLTGRAPVLVPTPAFAVDFIGGQSTGISLTRSGTDATYFDGSGVLQTVPAADTFRFDHDPVSPYRRQGLLVEEARTNNALHCRDLTNAAWVKTSTTAAKDATGLDGVANSASTLTASGASGTCVQTVTIASAQFTYSVYVKRKTGTGTIEITDNNFTNATDITASLSSSTWTRFDLTRTQANPVFGFRITTSGDEIEVDYNQLETGAFATSAVATTTVAVTRPADVCQITNLDAFTETEWTVFLDLELLVINAGTTVSVSFNDGSSNNRIELAFTGSGDQRLRLIVTDGGVSQVNMFTIGETFAAGDRIKAVITGKDNDFAIIFNNGTVFTDTAGTTPTGLTSLEFGTQNGGTQNVQPNAHYRQFAYWNRRLPNHVLKVLTA